MLIENELSMCRSIDVKSRLFPFAKSLSKWELLLMIAALDGDPAYGIWNYIDMLQTRSENPTTLYGFIKTKIDDGCLVVVDGDKKSRKTLNLSPRLRESLMTFLEKRANQMRPPVTNISDVVDLPSLAHGVIAI